MRLEALGYGSSKIFGVPLEYFCNDRTVLLALAELLVENRHWMTFCEISEQQFNKTHHRKGSAVFVLFLILPGSVETQVRRSYTFYNHFVEYLFLYRLKNKSVIVENKVTRFLLSHYNIQKLVVVHFMAELHVFWQSGPCCSMLRRMAGRRNWHAPRVLL